MSALTNIVLLPVFMYFLFKQETGDGHVKELFLFYSQIVLCWDTALALSLSAFPTKGGRLALYLHRQKEIKRINEKNKLDLGEEQKVS